MWTEENTLTLIFGLLSLFAACGGLAVFKYCCPNRYKSLLKCIQCCDKDNIDGPQGKDKNDSEDTQVIIPSIEVNLKDKDNIDGPQGRPKDKDNIDGPQDKNDSQDTQVITPSIYVDLKDMRNTVKFEWKIGGLKFTITGHSDKVIPLHDSTVEDPRDTDLLICPQMADDEPNVALDEDERIIRLRLLEAMKTRRARFPRMALSIEDWYSTSAYKKQVEEMLEDDDDERYVALDGPESPPESLTMSMTGDTDVPVIYTSCSPPLPPPLAQGLALDLAADFINYKMAPKGNPSNDTALALRKAGDEMILKVDADEQFRNVLEKLDFSLENGYGQFESLVDSMLQEGEVNWGCIVMVFVVGAILALMKYKDKDYIINWTGNIIHGKFSEWIAENGGWDSLHNLKIDTVQSS